MMRSGPHTETSGDQSPAIHARGDVTVTYGPTPEQVKELTKAAVAGAVGPLTDRITDLSQKLGLTQNAALTLLRVLGQQNVPLEQLPQKLSEVRACGDEPTAQETKRFGIARSPRVRG